LIEGQSFDLLKEASSFQNTVIDLEV